MLFVHIKEIFLLQEIRDVAQYLGIEPTVIAGEDLKKGGFGGV